MAEKTKVVVVRPNLTYAVFIGVLSSIATSYVLDFLNKTNLPLVSKNDKET